MHEAQLFFSPGVAAGLGLAVYLVWDCHSRCVCSVCVITLGGFSLSLGVVVAWRVLEYSQFRFLEEFAAWLRSDMQSVTRIPR